MVAAGIELFFGVVAALAAQDSVTVAAPPTSGENPGYVGHRAPLLAEPLIKLPVGSVRAAPDSWLARQIDAMANGMFGRLPDHSHWCRPDGSAWHDAKGKGDNGWEELPYWLKGFTSLAVLAGPKEWRGPRRDARSGAEAADAPLEDEKRLLLAQDWIEAILASQRDDGYFGPESNRALPDLWPNMPVLWAMRTWYEATGDPRILAFLSKYFRYELALPREKLLPDSWQKVRGGDNLEIVHWLYDRTGEAWLLELAAALHEKTADWTAGIASWHGVNFCQGFREPLQFFVQSHDAKHRDATLRDYAEMMDKFGQVPGGMFGADENCRPGCSDPRQGAEACSMVEFMASFEMLGAQTGETIWFDRCEDVAFNSLPAATDPDQRSLHYLTAPNLVACDSKDHSPGFENSGCMLAFSPDERYRCCQHNVVQGWPYFVEHLWFATRDRGLAAAMLAPCTVTAKVADGVSARIDVETEYPFGSSVVIRVVPERTARFPVYVRVPGWCDEARVVVKRVAAGPFERQANAPAKFLRFEREWGTGADAAEIRLDLPMKIRVRRFPANHDCAAVDRGPLTYSLDLMEEWKVEVSDEATGAGWKSAAVEATCPWNLGLLLDDKDPTAGIRFVEASKRAICGTCGAPVSNGPLRSFRPANAGHLEARGIRVGVWRTDVTGLVAPLQQSPVTGDMLGLVVRLVPMGLSRVRISAFPVIGHGADAHEWKTPMLSAASHQHDEPAALEDRVLPRSSIDHDIPRFTFWDHLGTVEWVQYAFPKWRNIARSGVYWFDDTGSGRCRVPKSWRVLWLDDDGAWKEVTNASGYAVAPDTMNEVTFDPVTTKSLRLEVTLQPEFSAGMFEWTVGE